MVNVDIADLNVLYDAYRASFKCSPWKEQSQKYELDVLYNLVEIKKRLETKTYKTATRSEFVISERGKKRFIHGSNMDDKTVRHALCDNILVPSLKPYLIHNNGASQKGKGVSFTRGQIEKDLHNFYLEYKSNDGYIGFIDLSKFYDNIQHDKVKELLYPKISESYYWLLDEIFKAFEIDVSYMTDEEFAHCLDVKFDSIEYHTLIPDELKIHQKMMKKSVDIGDQVSQDVGVFFPSVIDNYAKIVKGCKRYGRYMDDIYIICKDRDELKAIMNELIQQAENIGLFVNKKKTRICKLSSTFKYLQIKYSLSDKGKVIKRINPKAVTRERRKLKSYKRLLGIKKITYDRIEQSYKSWMGAYAKLMSKKQIKHMKSLYIDLFGKDPRWKKPQLNSKMVQK